MGEVYKARDTRLERTVAIKVLPEHLSQNVELRQRFEREAKAISALSHPHICGLFDVGEQDGTAYLVMEFLEGETVADRLGRGRIPTEQVLRFAIEIAGALDKAHKQGIVHRDLKPGNIMLTKSGVKLLDFGLAKLGIVNSSVSASLSTLGTQVSPGEPLTERGTILGTFQYMAPEQLEGKEADARSDIFSFGAVLYEMATGQKAFSGKSQASLIASILEHEPPAISSVQPLIPPALDRVVKTCLAKEPDDRWQTAHDLESELKWIAQVGSQAGVAAPVAARRKSRERLAWVAFGVAAIAAALFAIGYLRRAPQPAAPIRASLPLPDKMFLGEIALSPDGARLAYGLAKPGGQPQLWIRSLDAPAGQPVPDGENAFFPFWSPDGRFVAFFTGDGKLKRVDASGGSLLVICDAERGVGGTWNRDGTIVFAPAPTSALFRVPAGGGQPVAVTKLDASRGETAHRYPRFPPGRPPFPLHGREPHRAVEQSGQRRPRRLGRRKGGPALWCPSPPTPPLRRVTFSTRATERCLLSAWTRASAWSASPSRWRSAPDRAGGRISRTSRSPTMGCFSTRRSSPRPRSFSGSTVAASRSAPLQSPLSS